MDLFGSVLCLGLFGTVLCLGLSGCSVQTSDILGSGPPVDAESRSDGDAPLDLETREEAGFADAADAEAIDQSRMDAGSADRELPEMGVPCGSSGRNALFDPSLEQPDLLIVGHLSVSGRWFGDLSRIVEVPFLTRSGARVLEFRSTSIVPAGRASAASQVWQIVPRPEGVTRFWAQAWFERIDERTPTNRVAELYVWAFAGDVSAFYRQYLDRQSLQLLRSSVLTDDQSGWEVAIAAGGLPAEADFVVVELRAVEDQVNRDENEFEGIFVDDVCLEFE